MPDLHLDRLLDPEPLPLETGWERLDNGVLHVACRTDLRGCSGEMFEWWFRSRPDTQRYGWWHPIDHISSEWGGTLRADTHVGSEHIVVEKLYHLPPADLIIQFVDPTDLFSSQAYTDARRSGALSGAVVGRTGTSHTPPRTPGGDILGGRLLHLARDTDWGCVLRSHFYLDVDQPDPDDPNAPPAIPDALAPNLLQHCYEEFTFLSRFLPGLFAGENREGVPRPW